MPIKVSKNEDGGYSLTSEMPGDIPGDIEKLKEKLNERITELADFDTDDPMIEKINALINQLEQSPIRLDDDNINTLSEVKHDISDSIDIQLPEATSVEAMAADVQRTLADAVSSDQDEEKNEPVPSSPPEPRKKLDPSKIQALENIYVPRTAPPVTPSETPQHTEQGVEGRQDAPGANESTTTESTIRQAMAARQRAMNEESIGDDYDISTDQKAQLSQEQKVFYEDLERQREQIKQRYAEAEDNDDDGLKQQCRDEFETNKQQMREFIGSAQLSSSAGQAEPVQDDPAQEVSGSGESAAAESDASVVIAAYRKEHLDDYFLIIKEDTENAISVTEGDLKAQLQEQLVLINQNIAAIDEYCRVFLEGSDEELAAAYVEVTDLKERFPDEPLVYSSQVMSEVEKSQQIPGDEPPPLPPRAEAPPLPPRDDAPSAQIPEPPPLPSSRKAASPAASDEAASPAASDEAASPAASGEDASPAASGEAASPAASGEAASPAASGEAASPAASGEAAIPAASGEAASPAASGEAASPAASGEAASPAASVEPASPAASGEAASPAASGEAASPAASVEAASPAASGEAAIPAASGEAASPAASGEAASPAASVEAASPAASGEAASPAASGEAASPAASGEAASPAASGEAVGSQPSRESVDPPASGGIPKPPPPPGGGHKPPAGTKPDLLNIAGLGVPIPSTGVEMIFEPVPEGPLDTDALDTDALETDALDTDADNSSLDSDDENSEVEVSYEGERLNLHSDRYIERIEDLVENERWEFQRDVNDPEDKPCHEITFPNDDEKINEKIAIYETSIHATPGAYKEFAKVANEIVSEKTCIPVMRSAENDLDEMAKAGEELLENQVLFDVVANDKVSLEKVIRNMDNTQALENFIELAETVKDKSQFAEAIEAAQERLNECRTGLST